MTQTSGTRPDAAIQAVIDERIAALRAKDADRVLANYAPDAVTFDLAPPLGKVGAAALDKGLLEAWFDTWQGPIGWEVEGIQITAQGDVAFCHGFIRISGTKIDGEQPDLWARETLCLQKKAGAWKVVHEHSSVPFYMDGSYKAAIDLKP